jgi:hypothetical protein
MAYEDVDFVVFDPAFCQATKDAGGQCKMRPVKDGPFKDTYCTAHRKKALKSLEEG